jgi:hypothetical protein
MVGQKNTDGGNIFQFMKSEEQMAGEYSEPEKICSELAGTHNTIKKLNSDENSGVQKVRNRINRGISRNSERISQQSPQSRQLLKQTSCTKTSSKCTPIFCF